MLIVHFQLINWIMLKGLSGHAHKNLRVRNNIFFLGIREFITFFLKNKSAFKKAFII